MLQKSKHSSIPGSEYTAEARHFYAQKQHSKPSATFAGERMGMEDVFGKKKGQLWENSTGFGDSLPYSFPSSANQHLIATIQEGS